jgi:transcriptional antiterminator RfaH
MKGRILVMIYGTGQPCDDALWYVIHCQPRNERYAANAIKSHLGLSVYIPEYKRKYHGTIKHFPLFPGYIFVQADLQKVPLSQINANPGVLRLVTFGEDPQPIPHNVIEEIAERSKHIDTFMHEPFRPGDVVRVKHGGPLQDLEMIFIEPMTGSRRVCVLLSFLGRLKQVHLDEETLEKVPSRAASEHSIVDSYARRERYTRGKGRKVKYPV